MNYLRLIDGYQNTAMANAYRDALSRAGQAEIGGTNPSFITTPEGTIFSFRTIHARSGRPCTMVVTQSRTINLNKKVRDAQGARLFKAGGCVYAAIDTVAKPLNDMTVMRVWPERSEPIRLLYDGRHDIERNWIFTEHGGRLFCVYSLAPLVVLQVVERQADYWRLVPIHRDDAVRVSSIHNGGSMAVVGDDSYMVAHRAVPVEDGYIGVGSLAKLNLQSFALSVSPDALFASLPAMCGRKPRRVGLKAITYFAGLEANADALTASYGINDEGYGFADLPVNLANNAGPLKDAINADELAFAEKMRADYERQRKILWRDLTADEIAKVKARAEICRSCPNARDVKLDIADGKAAHVKASVQCSKCKTCGGGMSLFKLCPIGNF